MNTDWINIHISVSFYYILIYIYIYILYKQISCYVTTYYYYNFNLHHILILCYYLTITSYLLILNYSRLKIFSNNQWLIVYRISLLNGKILWIFLCSNHKLSYKPHIITSPFRSISLPSIFKGFFPVFKMYQEISCKLVRAVDFLNLSVIWH
jgi:hypothetical protein